jgi:hypothetical protein
MLPLAVAIKKDETARMLDWMPSRASTPVVIGQGNAQESEWHVEADQARQSLIPGFSRGLAELCNAIFPRREQSGLPIRGECSMVQGTVERFSAQKGLGFS